MQTLTLFFLSLLAFAHTLPVPFTNNESVSQTPATVSATSNSSPSINNKYVVAHHMVGNTFPYTAQSWLNDIILAHASGIDAFALNMGSDDWQPARVADAWVSDILIPILLSDIEAMKLCCCTEFVSRFQDISLSGYVVRIQSSN